MKSAAFVGAFALFVTGITVAAQDAQVTSDRKVSSQDGKVVTMSGCVEVGGGTSFVLTNITSEQARHERTPSLPAGALPVVELKGFDLGPYIQQRVELTGVVVPAASKRDTQDKIKVKETTRVDGAEGSEKTSSEATTVKVARGAAAQFLVASVKSLAPTCQP
jgi:hypothetical protein